MREYKTKKVEREITDKVICNRCKKVYVDRIQGEEWQWDEIHPFKIDFYYGSRHDLEQWCFDLCDSCLEEIVAEFQIKAELIMRSSWE